jgi:hypothetical protein
MRCLTASFPLAQVVTAKWVARQSKRVAPGRFGMTEPLPQGFSRELVGPLIADALPDAGRREQGEARPA